jgi:death-on-curing protein
VKRPEHLTLAEVLEIHSELVDQHGGSGEVRDLGLLESALTVPQVSFDGAPLHASIITMAAAYAFHISQNQPFMDGNKRAALGAALVFLEMNGVVVNDPRGELYGAMIGLATRTTGKEDMAELLKRLADS